MQTYLFCGYKFVFHANEQACCAHVRHIYCPMSCPGLRICWFFLRVPIIIIFCSTHSCRACSSSMAIRSSLISACSFSMVTSSLCTKTSPSTITLGAGGRTGGVLGRSGLICLGIKCSATCSESSESHLRIQAGSILALYPHQRQRVLQTFGKSGVWNIWGDSSVSGCSTAPWGWKVSPQPSSWVICKASINFFPQIKGIFEWCLGAKSKT